MTVNIYESQTIEKVGVALTGAAAILPLPGEFTAPDAAALKAKDYKLPTGFKGLGLRTTDGAPEWDSEKQGDAIEFFEDGHVIDNGLVEVTCQMTLAQSEPLAVELQTGTKLDENGVAKLDLSGNNTRYVLYTEQIYKTGDPGKLLIIRKFAEGKVKEFKELKSERGQVQGYEVTFVCARSKYFDNKHLLYAQLYVEA